MMQMRYSLVKNYRNDGALRKSFNALMSKTYFFDLESWFQNGFWGDKYIPYSFADAGRIVANVSVNVMDCLQDGVPKQYLQLGTVMTDTAYRGQGLSRLLMEEILADYKGSVDGIYLFGNDSVIDFYPKFGFQKGTEYQHAKSIPPAAATRLQHVDMSDAGERQKFLDAAAGSAINARLSSDNVGLLAFWATDPLADSVYYDPAAEAYIIAEMENSHAMLHQVISSRRVSLDSIIDSFGRGISRITLGFTPVEAAGWEITERHAEDETFFFLGEDLRAVETNRLMFPTLSHA
jgi:GNAT superfamily N-acetyltransferase